MKTVIQGKQIIFDLTFYDKEPQAGGLPTDTDHYLHTWQVQNDVNDRLAAVEPITLLASGVFPAQTKFYFQIFDNGTTLTIKGYLSDADRLAQTGEIVSTGSLAYGVYTQQAMSEVGGSGYAGTVSFTLGATIGTDVFENFEIEDIGQTDPTYHIVNENNTTVVSETVFPVRVDVGEYRTTYDVPLIAVPGINWRLVARGKIGGVDTFIDYPFRVVEVAVAVLESARLITLDELKRRIRLTGNNNDAHLLNLLDAACGIVENYTSQAFHVLDKIEYFDGNGMKKLAFDNAPIYLIQKVEKRWGMSEWVDVPVTNFIASDFFLERIDEEVFDAGNKNWRITYQYGIDSAPEAVRQGVATLVRHLLAIENRTGVTGDTVGSGLKVSYESVVADLPNEVKMLLSAYTRIT